MLDIITEGTEINEDIVEDFIHEILKIIEETQLFNSIDEEQKNEINQLIRLMNKNSIRNKPMIVSAINELKFGEEKFLEDDIILEKIIADANISKKDNQLLLDFSRVGYSNVAQNYLIEYIYGNKKIPLEYLKELQTYKVGGFFHYANLLRGNFSEIEKTYIDQTRKKELSDSLSFKHVILIPEVVKQIINLQYLMKRMPTRKYDIVINRIEANIYDCTSRTETAGFLSFSSSDNIEIVPGLMLAQDGIDYYKMILPKDMMCLPIELIDEETVKNAGFECEFLMPYFSYDILNLKDDGENRKITIGNPKVKDIRQLLLKRLRELQEFAKDNPKCTEQLQEDIKEYIDIVEKSLENENNNIDQEKNAVEGR